MRLLVLVLTLSVPAAATAGEIADPAWFPGTSSVREREVIPFAFRGRWAPVEGACEAVEGVSYMTVYDVGADYYESGARLERITQAGQPRSVKMKFAYEGEGEFWETEEVWTLSPDGRLLTIAAGDSAPIVLQSCR